MIFIALLIPFIFAIVKLSFFKSKVVWWEIFVPFCVSLIFALIIKYSVETAITTDEEYHTGWVVESTYYEEWTEKCTRTETDQKGNIKYITYYVNHPEYYTIKDSNGYTIQSDRSEFDYFCKLFNNKHFLVISRFSQSSWGDGNAYYTLYNNKEESFIPLTTKHQYKNKIQASNSVYKRPKVDAKTKEIYHLYDYPEFNYYNFPSILGHSPNSAEANKLLSKHNAKLGRTKQVRMWILIFNNQPIDAAIQQENYWQNGNKNEIVLCIGKNNDKIDWTYVFSWTEQERLKVDIKNFSRENENIVDVVNYMAKEVSKNWKRKEFADFNYLTVETPMWAVFLNLILTFAINVGLSIWIVGNEFNIKHPFGK